MNFKIVITCVCLALLLQIGTPTAITEELGINIDGPESAGTAESSDIPSTTTQIDNNGAGSNIITTTLSGSFKTATSAGLSTPFSSSEIAISTTNAVAETTAAPRSSDRPIKTTTPGYIEHTTAPEHIEDTTTTLGHVEHATTPVHNEDTTTTLRHIEHTTIPGHNEDTTTTAGHIEHTTTLEHIEDTTTTLGHIERTTIPGYNEDTTTPDPVSPTLFGHTPTTNTPGPSKGTAISSEQTMTSRSIEPTKYSSDSSYVSSSSWSVSGTDPTSSPSGPKVVSSTESNENGEQEKSQSSITQWGIALMVVGVLALVGIVVGIVVYTLKAKSRDPYKPWDEEMNIMPAHFYRT